MLERARMGYAAVTAEELAAVEGLNDFFEGDQFFDELGRGRTKKLLTAFKGGRWRSRLDRDDRSALTMSTEHRVPTRELA